MKDLLRRTVLVAGSLTLLGALVVSSGCSNSRSAAGAQSPPPPSLSAPVRPEPAYQAPSAVASGNDYAPAADLPVAASRPLPVMTPPPQAEVASPAPATTGDKPGFYTMQRGDTLYGIARKFNLKPKDLIAANNFSDPNHLAVGTKVRLP